MNNQPTQQSALVADEKNEINQQLDQLNQQLREVSPIELTRYINEANSFLQQYWNYLQQKKQWQNARNLIIELKLVIKNDGSTPAQDTEIDIELPENAPLSFIRLDQFPVQPLSPSPPAEPRLNGAVFGEAIIGIWGWLFKKKDISASQLNPVRQAISPGPSEENVIKFRQNERKTKISIRKAKHTQSILLPPLYLCFNHYSSAQSFNFNYKILADNTPEPACGNLHVVINKPLILLPALFLSNI